jgi:hypothetical protein
VGIMRRHCISLEYLKRESVDTGRSSSWIDMNTGDSVYDWTIKYLKRNKIPYYFGFDKFSENQIIIQIIMEFKSFNQLKWFVNNGNRVFPYFEFW